MLKITLYIKMWFMKTIIKWKKLSCKDLSLYIWYKLSFYLFTKECYNFKMSYVIVVKPQKYLQSINKRCWEDNHSISQHKMNEMSEGKKRGQKSNKIYRKQLNKVAKLRSYLTVITSTIDGLNSPVKRHALSE